jgi:hypothetical protein
VRLRRSSRDRQEWGPEEGDRVRHQLLARLDPWSYWVAATPEGEFADFAVVGTSGAFAVAVCGLQGAFHADGDRLTVGGRPVVGLREIRGSARRMRGKLSNAAVFADVTPIVCLSRAAAGAALTVRGVRVVGLVDLVQEITGRERTLLPNRAQRGAQALGTVLSSGQGARPQVEDSQE